MMAARTGLIVFFALFFVRFSLIGGLVSAEDEGIMEYPDGDYGMDIGGGYQAIPSKEGSGYDFLPPDGYRDDLQDTRYGALEGQTLLNFPDYKVKGGDSGKVSTEVEEETPITDFLFTDHTTMSAGSGLWGVSGPDEAPDDI